MLNVIDLGSTHGTFVNGKRAPANAEMRIQNGETVTFGVRVINKDGIPTPPLPDSMSLIA